MLSDALRRVRGAVSTKDLLPVLTHFVFNKGTVAGFDGRLYIQANLPKSCAKLSCTIDAKRFTAAMDVCDGEPTLSQAPGKLLVSRGKFTAELATGDIAAAVPPMPDPPAKGKVPASLLERLAIIRPFIGEDASRQWACGLLIDGDYAYATNNVVLVRMEMIGFPGKEPVSIPSFAIDELLRIGEVPTGIGRSKNSITFHYADSSWLRTTVFDTTWPKPPDTLLAKKGKKLEPIPEGLLAAIRQVIPFCPDSKNPIIELSKDAAKTAAGDFSAKVEGLKGRGMQGFYRAEALLLVLEVAKHADWSEFPRVPWTGDHLIGIMVGIHT